MDTLIEEARSGAFKTKGDAVRRRDELLLHPPESQESNSQSSMSHLSSCPPWLDIQGPLTGEVDPAATAGPDEHFEDAQVPAEDGVDVN